MRLSESSLDRADSSHRRSKLPTHITQSCPAPKSSNTHQSSASDAVNRPEGRLTLDMWTPRAPDSSQRWGGQNVCGELQIEMPNKRQTLQVRWHHLIFFSPTCKIISGDVDLHSSEFRQVQVSGRHLSATNPMHFIFSVTLLTHTPLKHFKSLFIFTSF